MPSPDQLEAHAAHGTFEDSSAAPSPDRRSEPEPGSGRAIPMLWQVFAANAAVFALAFALLAFTPVTVHARIRLIELVILIAGLVAMLAVDLVLLRHALRPLTRLTAVMGSVDRLRPGQRAVGFDGSSSEVQALAHAFNEMLGRLEDERRDSSGRVLAAQEAERLRIARELHDEIGQTLTAVAVRAEHGAESAGNPAEFRELAEIVQQSLADVRRISLELRPSALDELGLVNALISLCARVSAQCPVRVHRALDSSVPELPPEVELALYRIAQEALTNVVRHSGATEVTVGLSHPNQDLVLSVSDDGRGVPTDVVAGGGVAGMRERAMLIGAEFAIDADAGAGTTVTVRIPVTGGPERPPR